MSRMPGHRLLFASLVLAAVLAASAYAFAATRATLKLAGPTGTLRANVRYTVTATGTVSGAGLRLAAYEGGRVGGDRHSISCLSSEAAEWRRYRPSPRIHVFLGARPVSGHFSITWRFSAIHPGPRSFCAYITTRPTGPTYAQASLHWTNLDH